MANKSAYFQRQITYTDPDGNQVTSTKQVTALYEAQNHAQIDVPDATASGTTFNVPFGSIAADATCGSIENLTGQPLEVKINGAAAASQTIPSGGTFDWANPVAAGSTPILSIALKTTAIQSGAGSIITHVFGDPSA